MAQKHEDFRNILFVNVVEIKLTGIEVEKLGFHWKSLLSSLEADETILYFLPCRLPRSRRSYFDVSCSQRFWCTKVIGVEYENVHYVPIFFAPPYCS